MSKYKFKVGDKVVMNGTQMFRGRPVTDVLPPVKGVIKSIPGGGVYEANLTYNVRWERLDGSRAGSNYMDESCLDEPVKPVTDEELAEVYKILGVS